MLNISVMKNRLFPVYFWKAVFVFFVFCSSAAAALAGPPSAAATVGSVKVSYVETIPAARHPELLYWFWTNETLTDRRYLQDVREIAEKSRFTLALITDRTKEQGAVFHDVKKMHDVFAEVVTDAHARGLKLGLQLWAEGYPKLGKDDAVAMISEGEVTLDAEGRAGFSSASRWFREGGSDATAGRHEPLLSEPLKAFAFRKTADGVYRPDSLVELPASALNVTQSDAGSIKLEINAPASLAGNTVYVMVAHYHQFPDLFNDVMSAHLLGTLRAYRDIPFDATALDEFGWPMVQRGQPDHSPFRERFYGKAFAREYLRLKGRPLETDLFYMRYSPEGDPTRRIRAINDYFDVMRQGPLRVERAFHDFSRELFGPKTFAGIHNTFHNGLEVDETWRTGLNWWRVPRAYGQSDENIGLPVRMGLLLNADEPVMYDQYYTPDLSKYTTKVMAEARYNVRTHYHAWNDKGRWGRDIGAPGVLPAINALEDKIRLLNQFDPAAPKLPLLVVFGMPSQLDWFPDAAARNAWDIHAIGAVAKTQAVWDAGYPCALVSSEQIDDGKLTVDSAGRPVLNGHTFGALIYLFPQYATPSTLAFLEHYAQVGGKFMMEGAATRDFAGVDITQRFAAIAAKATVRGFDVNQIPALAVAKANSPDMCWLEDGAVVFSDADSLKRGKPKPFEVTLGGHLWSGAYVGVFALKTDAAGRIEKLAAGGFSQLRRDGLAVISLGAPADLVVRRGQDGNYEALVKGASGAPMLTMP